MNRPSCDSPRARIIDINGGASFAATPTQRGAHAPSAIEVGADALLIKPFDIDAPVVLARGQSES